MVRVATGAAGERTRIAFETGADGGGERRKNTVLALAEVDGVEDGGLGIAGFGGLGDFQEQSIAADLEGRGVEALGLRLAPVPDGVEHAEAGTAEALAAADAPVVFRGRGEALAASVDLRAALLVEPVEAAEALELLREQIAQLGAVETEAAVDELVDGAAFDLGTD